MAQAKQSESRIIKDLKAKLLEERSIEFATKIVEHQVKKDTLAINEETIKEKQKILNEEKQFLEEIKEKTYKLQNDFCDSIWKFSKNHDFGNFLVNYPREKLPSTCNCEFFEETAKNIEKEIQKNEEIRKLTFEVTTLKLELETLENEKILEEEINKASEELKSFSEEDNEIQRLTKALQNSQHELESIQTEIKDHLQKEEKEIIAKNTELNSASELKKKKATKNDRKTAKKFKVSKETAISIPSLNHPNTIDNYLILKKKNSADVEKAVTEKKQEEIIKESKVSNGIKGQKLGILSSWTRCYSDSPISVENSAKKESLEYAKQYSSTDIPYKGELTNFPKPEMPSKESMFENQTTKFFVREEKSIFSGFTPKKQSAIAEKLFQKH